METKVHLILNKKFGSQLKQISPESIVWVVDSAENKPVVQEIWENLRQSGSASQGRWTTFDFNDQENAAEACLYILSDIDDHHPWTEIAVYGVSLDSQLENLLRVKYNPVKFEATREGFRLLKSNPIH